MASQPEVLDTLARTLLTKGPKRTLSAAPKRVRIRVNGRFVADTTEAVYVWEHEYYPHYYLPASSFAPGSLVYPSANPDAARGYALADVAGLKGMIMQAGPLAGLVRVGTAAPAEWFEEDVRMHVHPKDPFRRVDVLFSSRPVSIRVRGVEVAAATSCFQLYETGLPVRFYLAATSVCGGAVLEDSETVTACPYKGRARYFHLRVPGVDELLRDLVWCYEDPIVECASIRGCLCFYNEKVDVLLDGVVLRS
ncbi:DUF427-domain-containing protein [Xylaria nigripes]|nr:DUF427-domain-containing protein [Xylaria nigripes]